MRRRALSFAVLVLAAYGTLGAGKALAHFTPSTPYPSAAAIQTACGFTGEGPFNVQGNQVIGSTGAVFRPYGITVFGLSEPDWGSTVSSDEAQINAMATAWHANTVRIQVSPTNLFSGPAHHTNQTFLAALSSEIVQACDDHLVVVLTAQTEKYRNGTKLPDQRTVNYWGYLGGWLTGANNIIFDLFNEPRLTASTSSATWTLWHDGGMYDGKQYVGMQTLVNDVRGDGIGRLVWVQGPYDGDTLSQVPSHPIAGRDVVYDIHHPFAPHNATGWNTDFGNLAKTSPVVVGEWTQYSSATAGECWKDALTAAPAFLTYLQQRGIGLVAWTLERNVLISASSLTTPTTFNSNYSCATTQDEGVGVDLMSYFAAQNPG